jgi:pyruvate/2-oxoglutarate dehydrogenase complex dihydrolipoamide acyltransferase (E2) component
MATKVIMPQLGESVVEGTVTRWLRAEGESIVEFEPLLEVNTDKVDTEIPSPATGVVLKLYVEAGQTVNAGTVLAFIGQPGDAVPQAPAASRIASDLKPTAPAPATAAAEKYDLGFISPVVARMAAEHDVDLSEIQGSGRDGRITKKDVLAYIESGRTQSPPAPWEEPASGELFRPSEEIFGPKAAMAGGTAAEGPQPLSPVRRAIADHMLRSKHTSPHVTTVMEVDLTRVVAHRQANKTSFEREGLSLTYTAYFIEAAVQALKAFPIVNSSWSDQGIVFHKAVNIGMAVSMGDEGLIVPVIPQADRLSLRALAAAVNDLARRARAHQLKPDEVQGGTFTLTNHGVSGSLFATPIINQPQCAILGAGAIQKRPVVVETSSPDGTVQDALVIRPMAYLTLTFDHRILDGAMADHFLGRVVERLAGWS